jgi:hypothetical protein
MSSQEINDKFITLRPKLFDNVAVSLDKHHGFAADHRHPKRPVRPIELVDSAAVGSIAQETYAGPSTPAYHGRAARTCAAWPFVLSER